MIQTVTVKSAGGDYSTLQAAEAGEQGDIVAGGYSLVIQCFTFEDTAATAFDAASWTTDSTHFVTIETPISERHTGRWTTTAYRMNLNAAFVYCLQVDVVFTVVDGLQFQQNMSSATGAAIDIRCADVTVQNCIARFTGTSTGPIGFMSASADRGKWRNNLAYDFDGGAAGVGFQISTSSAGDFWVYNCGAVGCWNGFSETFQDPVIKNSYSQSTSNDGFVGTWDAASDYNLSDLAADAPGGNSKNSATITFVDAASDDYHLSATDTGARDSGTDLSADADQPFDDDLDGNERLEEWDIGPNEYLAHDEKRLIKPSGQGGDYTLVANWEVGEADDLVHAGKRAIASIEGDWTSDSETTRIDFDDAAWLSDPTRNPVVRTVGTARHDGKWTTAAYKVVSTSSGANIDLSYLEIDGLQIESSAASSSKAGLFHNPNADGGKIHHNLIRFTGSGTACFGIRYNRDDLVECWNNIIYDFDTSGSFGIDFVTASLRTVNGTFYNNTIVDCETGFELEAAASSSATALLKNMIVQGSTTAYLKAVAGGTETWHASSTNNLADDATAPGSAPVNSATVLFVNAGADDFHLDGTDTSAHQGGVDLSADATLPFNDDIDDEARFDPWDIGADQVPAMTGGIPSMFNRGMV